MKNKLIPILLILFLFTIFTAFEIYQKADNVVLEIISPTIINIDLNSNKIVDTGETVCVSNIEALTSDLSQNQTELTKQLNLSFEDGIKLGYLTDMFAENTLLEKHVKIKFTGQENQNCKFADVYLLNKISYKDLLFNSGLGFVNGKQSEKFHAQLEKAKKLHLVILNHKSNKFHTLNCKYGQIAHDAIILPEKQIPRDAKPCKFCHVLKEDKKHQKEVKKDIIQPYPLVISDGNIKMFLTDFTTTLKPDNKCTKPVCKEALSLINSSQKSIDIALYGWNNIPDIYEALQRAKSRGVQLRIVYDTSVKDYYPDTQNLVKLANKTSTDNKKELMHNKFMIFDNAKVLTGSMNFSQTGFSGFNSNCVLSINSPEIANIYKSEFEQMLNGKFHSAKSKVAHNTVVLGKTKITPFFSPKDKIITNNVITLIDNAKHYVFVPTFIITHKEFSEALSRAQKRNVTVKIITDATNTTATKSKIKYLRQSGIAVKVENYAGKMHSKSIIIDDKYIIVGSMNFSNSGENINDENCLIIEDERLARYYRGFFEYLWAKIPDKYLKFNPKAEGKSSIGSCSDGIDNNYDGKIDLQDEACK